MTDYFLSELNGCMGIICSARECRKPKYAAQCQVLPENDYQDSVASRPCHSVTPPAFYLVKQIQELEHVGEFT